MDDCFFDKEPGKKEPFLPGYLTTRKNQINYWMLQQIPNYQATSQRTDQSNELK